MYDAENNFYEPTRSGGAQIGQGTGTPIGNLTLEGGLAKIFDGVTDEATGTDECARLTNSPDDGWAGKDWGDGNDRVVGSAKLYGPNDTSLARDMANTFTSVDARLEGSDNGSDWDVLDTQATGTDTSAIITFTYAGATAYRYHRIVIPAVDSNSDKYAAEIEFFEPESIDNAALVSEGFSVSEVPDTAAIMVQVIENESITINTDLVAKISRDDGANFATATLSLYATVGDEKFYAAENVDLSGQPSGTDIVYEIDVNGVDVQVLGVGVLPGG